MPDPSLPVPIPVAPDLDIYGKKAGEAGAWDRDRAAGDTSGPRPPDPPPPSPAAPPVVHAPQPDAPAEAGAG